LVFQGDGAELPQVKRRVKELGMNGCVFKPYAPRETFLTSLLEVSVLIATRKPSTCGLLWPSKLALLQDLPVPLLWVGDTESHLATALKQREKTGVFAPTEIE